MPAVTRRPTVVAPIPVTPRAPLLPLKATVGESVAEVFVDVPVTGIELLGVVELLPEVEEELLELRKVGEVWSTKGRGQHVRRREGRGTRHGA